jgi:hypothetical protein
MPMIEPMAKCPVDGVNDVIAERLPSGGGVSAIKCKRCGSFRISDNAVPEIERLEKQQRAIISGWIREQNDIGEFPKIISYDVDRLKQLPAKPVAERIDRLLRAGIALQGSLGRYFPLSAPELVARTYSVDANDVHGLALYLVEERLLAFGSGSSATVSARGFVQGQTAASIGATAFIAMWFNETMKQAREAMQAAVTTAGYEPVVVDAVEHINKIDDEIISQIRKCRFLVADCTGHCISKRVLH